MATARFYIQRLQAGRLQLPAEESSHASRSRRLGVGDAVVLFDGLGKEARAKIVEADRGGLAVEAEAPVERPRPSVQLTLACALPKGPRQDVLIEKCTELGIRGFLPLKCERSVASTTPHKREKWQRRTIEAAKQSGQCWLPEIGSLTDVRACLEQSSAYDAAIVACTLDDALAGVLSWDAWRASHTSVRQVLAFIGPEGGWSLEELDAFTEAGVQGVSLGPGVLRIETAAIALAALTHAMMRG